MNLILFDIDNHCLTLEPVSSNKLYSKKGFHPEGLFSEKIFGPTKNFTCGCGVYWGRSKKGEKCGECGVDILHSNVRRQRYAKIELPFPILNPIMFYIISKIGKVTVTKVISDIIFEEKVFGYYYDPQSEKYIQILNTVDDSSNQEGSTETVALDLQQELARLNVVLPEGAVLFRGTDSIRDFVLHEANRKIESEPKWKFVIDNIHQLHMKNVLICPPEFRPISKTKDVQMRDEMNKFYMTILNFALQMNQEDLDTLESDINIKTINFRHLQRYVFDLYEFIFSKFSKKTGLIRGFILGKRVDYSGRAVICPDPTLRLDQCSLPYKMVLELYKLDIINKLIENRVYKRYDPAIKYVDKCIETEDYSLYDTACSVVNGKHVMLNRQPTLHRMGLLAFKANVNKDYVIKIPPMACDPYNADFDGDQMAVYIPLYDETENECAEKLAFTSNLISPSTGNLIVGINQDMVLGLYLLTKKEEGKEIDHNGIKTYEGRVKFNSIFPSNWPFINKTITKKELTALLNVLSKMASKEELITILDKIKELGFRETTLRGTTMSLKSMRVPDCFSRVQEICDSSELSINQKHFLLNSEDITQQIKESFPYRDFIDSGSRGSWDQVKQLIFCRGFVSNSKGAVVPTPVRNNLINGLDRDEFFVSCFGSRKSLLDVALNTGVSGYLTRKLVYSAVNLETDETLQDCGTTDGYNLAIPSTIENPNSIDPIKLCRSLIGRNIEGENNTIVQITHDNYHDYLGKTVKLFSPLFCKSPKLCRKCYGNTHQILHSKYVGVVAAQALGEVATQLTLRTFHIGGIAQMREGQGDTQKDIINDLSVVKKLLHATTHHPYDSLIMQLFSIYSNHKVLLLVHFECIVSMMMRHMDRRWRLSPERDITKYEMVSIENIPAMESFLLALAFCKPYKYIVSGILGDTTSTDGILERIMLNRV